MILILFSAVCWHRCVLGVSHIFVLPRRIKKNNTNDQFYITFELKENFQDFYDKVMLPAIKGCLPDKCWKHYFLSYTDAESNAQRSGDDVGCKAHRDSTAGLEHFRDLFFHTYAKGII